MQDLDFLPFGDNRVPYRQADEDEDEEPDIHALRGQIFCCKTCSAHMTAGKDIVSREFHGSSGKAYLFSTAINAALGPHEERKLRTGMHTVCDVRCIQCDTYLGWKYIAAVDTSQRYKVNKYVFELAHVRRMNNGRRYPMDVVASSTSE